MSKTLLLSRFAKAGTTALLSRELVPASRALTRLAATAASRPAPGLTGLVPRSQKPNPFERSVAPSLSHAFSTRTANGYSVKEEEKQEKDGRKFEWIDEVSEPNKCSLCQVESCPRMSHTLETPH